MTLKPFPLLQALDAALRSKHRFSAEIVARGLAEFGESWAADFERTLGATFSSSEAIGAAARGYAAFAMHSMRLQTLFEREGRYQAKTHSDASVEVYLNERHMADEYLPGLLLSHFLWPHHYRQLRFFESAFVQRLAVAGTGRFLEVGVGTGVYSARVLAALPGFEGLGLDISPFARDFALRQVSGLGCEARYRVELRDVLTVPPASLEADWLICVEVLEHLDDPVPFLRALRQQLRPQGRAFITAAVNAAHADHIYLYRNAGEVLAHMTEAGFTLEQSFVGMAYPPPRAGVPVPEAVAFIVT